MDFSDELATEYVGKLRRGVERNLSIPHRFVCVTNVEAIEQVSSTIRLNALSWLGCLPKVMAFDPSNGFEGRVLVFDIDNVIVGSLDEMAEYNGHLCVRDGFRGQGPDGDMISFDARSELAQIIWKYFERNYKKVEKRTGGRERYYYRSIVRKLDVWQNVCPGQVCSYKRHCRGRGKVPKRARVVSFHGDPRPHRVEDRWMKEHWI